MPRTRWGTELRRARIAAGLSLGDVARLAGVSRSTVSRAEDDNIDTGISTYETLAQICGIALHPEHPNPTQRTDDPAPPDTYPNPRHDDPWDNDTVQWLLTHDRVLDA